MSSGKRGTQHPDWNPEPSEDDWGPDLDWMVPDRQADLNRRAVEAARARAHATTVLAADGWREPSVSVSLAEARKKPPPAPRYLVDGVVAEKTVVLLAAAYKTGKTTLALDLAASVAAEEPWLGRFPVDFPAGNIGYWNVELAENRMYEWMDSRCDEAPAVAERVFPVHLRGFSMDLRTSICADWTRKWLCDNDIRLWIFDPIGRNLAEENSNTEVNAWWSALEAVVADTPVSEGAVLLIHHAGHGETGKDALPRGRGASALGGNADDLLFFRHGGKNGDLPPDDMRYLSGIGRFLDLDGEVVLAYDRETRVFRADGEGRTREDDRAARGAEEAREALELGLLREKSDRINQSQLLLGMRGQKQEQMAKIRAAITCGLILEEKHGYKNSTWYSIPGGEEVRAA